MITKEQVVESMPAHLKAVVTQDLVDKVNAVSTDPDVAEHIRSNFISYTSVLKEGRFKTEDYLNAVAYVSYKLMGYNNEESYARTFPARHAALKAKGSSSKDISAYVSAYNRGKMVNLILEQTIIPSWVLNQDVYQDAIRTQAELMMTARSEKVRSDAANSILTHLKKPEKKEVELSISAEDTSGMSEMKAMLEQVATRQQELIGEGVSTREIAHQEIIMVNDVPEAKELEPVEKPEPEDTEIEMVVEEEPMTDLPKVPEPEPTPPQTPTKTVRKTGDKPSIFSGWKKNSDTAGTASAEPVDGASE